MISITKPQQQLIKTILQQILPKSTAWAFGSRTTGTQKIFSDIDLAIENTTELSFHQSGALREAFQNSDLPFRVDFVDLYTLDNSFKKLISPNFQKI